MILKHKIVIMGILKDIVRGRSSNKYSELSNADLSNPPGEGQQVKFVNVKSQDDLVNAKEALHDDTVVILDISMIESNGISLDVIYGELDGAVELIGGDLLHKKRNDIIVATPNGVGISRKPL